MHLTTSAADFSKETLVVKEEETYDAGVFERVEAEVVKLLKEPQSLVSFRSTLPAVSEYSGLGLSGALVFSEQA